MIGSNTSLKRGVSINLMAACTSLHQRPSSLYLQLSALHKDAPTQQYSPDNMMDGELPVMVGGPVPEMARQGRHKQRYAATGERLVAGCIPVRITGDQSSLQNVEILLISSRAGKGYCFPKGGWEDDETVENAAKRETVEEAGVRGELEEPQIGMFHFTSGKPGSHQKSVHQGRCIAHMYVLHVAEMLDVWPESEERQRIWVPLVEAVWRCRHDWMREALLTWVRRKGWLAPGASLDSIYSLQQPGSLQLQPATSRLDPQEQQQQQDAMQLASCGSSAPTTINAHLDNPGHYGTSSSNGMSHAALGTLAHPQLSNVATTVHALSNGGAPSQSPTNTARFSLTFASGNSISTCCDSDNVSDTGAS